jgi:hypothetical protein
MADKVKPLVDVNLVSEFGGIEDLESFKVEGPTARDYTYVPGFSDMRYKRDLDLGAFKRHEIKSNEVSILPVNCRWFRTVKGTGSDPDQMRIAHSRNQGYRAVTKDDIGQPWLTALPPGAQIAPDGTIKSAAGDLVLSVVDQQGAARNAMRRKIATEDMVDGMEMMDGGLGVVGKQVKGADPVVTKVIGERVIGGKS